MPIRRQPVTLHGRHKTVSFVVGSSVHLDLGGETIPYVAGWGENGALEAVIEFAATIDTIARQIEHAIDTDPSSVSMEPAPAV